MIVIKKKYNDGFNTRNDEDIAFSDFYVRNENKAPYYSINYDDISGSSTTVTSGTSYSNKTLYVHRRRKFCKSEGFLNY